MKTLFNFAHRIKGRKKNTPDLPLLNKENWHFMFVYGTLKKAGRLHGLMEGCKYLGRGVTALDCYRMHYCANASGFPVARSGEQYIGTIEGEVWLVPTEKVIRIDEIENNGEMYQRQSVEIILLDQKLRNGWNTMIDCAMYIGVDEWWAGTAASDCPHNMNKVFKSTAGNTRVDGKVYVF